MGWTLLTEIVLVTPRSEGVGGSGSSSSQAAQACTPYDRAREGPRLILGSRYRSTNFALRYTAYQPSDVAPNVLQIVWEDVVGGGGHSQDRSRAWLAVPSEVEPRRSHRTREGSNQRGHPWPGA